MWAYNKLVEFFGLSNLLSMIQNHQVTLGTLLTREGFAAVISPIFPFLLVLEIAFLIWVNRRSPKKISAAYKIPVQMYLANGFIGGLISLEVLSLSHDFFLRFALFQTPVGIYWLVYAYVVWELAHFVYHYTCHKVRLLWCFHSPHHAPAHMNLSVIFTSLFLQGTYATFIRTSICTVLGVPFPLLLLVMTIDSCWGSLIHVSEETWTSGRFRGIFGRLLLNPLHHRIHHSSNPEYIDTNYCNLLPVWDWAFGTLQHEVPGVKPRYGLVRKVNYDSFVDMYVGDVALLARDIWKAPGMKNKLLYLVMPPGWHPAELRPQGAMASTGLPD